jgi:Tn3 transposase DDE domain
MRNQKKPRIPSPLIFFYRLGEIRDRPFENQRYRAFGLNLAVAALILWNIVHQRRGVDELRSRGEAEMDDLLAHIAPLGWEHNTFNGDYVWPTKPLENRPRAKSAINLPRCRLVYVIGKILR